MLEAQPFGEAYAYPNRRGDMDMWIRDLGDRNGRHIAAVLLIAAALTAAFVEPELRADYSWYRGSYTGQWTYSQYTDSSGASNIKYSGYYASDRKMYVMASVTMPGYARAITCAYWPFVYDHDHDWVNQFRISYLRRGLGTIVENGDSEFLIRFYLQKKASNGIYYTVHYEDDTKIRKLGTALNDQSLVYCEFSYLLLKNCEYRIMVMVSAYCWQGASSVGSSALLDFWNRVTPQQYVKMGTAEVYHYNCIDYAYGGLQQGKRTQLTQRWWQHSYDYADGVGFSSYSNDSKTKRIVGWNATIDGFNSLGGAIASGNSKQVNYTADNTEGSDCTDVGRGSEIRVDVTHFLDKWSGSGSSMSISTPSWSQGSGMMAMPSEAGAFPMHEWGFYPVTGRDFQEHLFTMSNQDPESLLNIRSLKFLVSSVDYQDLGTVQFDSAATLYDFSVAPLGSWSTDVNGKGPFIYFKYDLAYPDSGTVWGRYETDAHAASGNNHYDFQMDASKKPEPNGAPYLHQNYPNPFNPSTEIAYDLPQECYVSIEIFDVMGQRVATLVRGMHKAGPNTVRWNGCNDRGVAAKSGIYVCRLSSESYVQNKKLVLLR